MKETAKTAALSGVATIGPMWLAEYNAYVGAVAATLGMLLVAVKLYKELKR